MIYSSFLCSTSLEGFERVLVDGVSPHDHFESLHEVIRREAGAAAAGVLCEPLISYGNGEVATSISWYAAYEGQAVPITALDPTRREAAEALLKARIDAITATIARSDQAELLAIALYVANPSDVYVIGREPVISNWAVVPEDVLATDSRRKAAFAAGLGALGIAIAAPPLTAQEFAGWRSALDVGGVDAPTGVEPNAEALGGTTAAPEYPPVDVASSAPPAHVPSYRRAWFPALLACVIAAIILALFLIPGVLLYPERARVAVLQDETDVLRDTNRVLEERLAQLRQARETGVCTADGTYEIQAPLLPPASGGAVPGTGATDPGSTTPPSDPAAVTPQDQSNVQQPLLPPPLEDLVPSDQDVAQGDAGNLLDRLDSGVVLVLGPTTGGVSIGTGFFVNATTVITNAHVISEADPSRLVVASRSLGRAVPVQIVAKTNVAQPGDLDFAALRGDFGAPEPLNVTPRVERLNQVVAAGFPLLINQENHLFQRLVQGGDASATPTPSTTRGVVTSIHTNLRGVGIIAHDADISRGNSGGPLVDLCGRVVGVNTFSVLDPETSARALYSINSDELVAFMRENGIAASQDDGTCIPRVATSLPAGPAAGDSPAATNPAAAEPDAQNGAPAPDDAAAPEATGAQPEEDQTGIQLKAPRLRPLSTPVTRLVAAAPATLNPSATPGQPGGSVSVNAAAGR